MSVSRRSRGLLADSPPSRSSIACSTRPTSAVISMRASTGRVSIMAAIELDGTWAWALAHVSWLMLITSSSSGSPQRRAGGNTREQLGLDPTGLLGGDTAALHVDADRASAIAAGLGGGDLDAQRLELLAHRGIVAGAHVEPRGAEREHAGAADE